MRNEKVKRFGFLDIVLIILIILILLSAFIFIVALVFPQATQRILTDLRTRFQIILGPEFQPRAPAVIQTLQERASEGYQYRIKPSFLKAKNFLFQPYFKLIRTLKTERERRAKELLFGKCVNCHKELFKRTALKSIYIDHKLHQTKNVACEKCHSKIRHPNPPGPREQVCLDCHIKIKAPTGCSDCHAPGSIFHSAIIAEEKTARFMGERIQKSLLPVGFEKWQAAVCKNCHNINQFCDRCHLAFHKDEPLWAPTHGPRIMKGELDMRTCWQCHNTRWCGDSCHRNLGRRRISPQYPVPLIPLGIP